MICPHIWGVRLRHLTPFCLIPILSDHPELSRCGNLPSFCLPDQLHVGIIYSCPTEMSSKHVFALICRSVLWPGWQTHALKSQPLHSERATQGQPVISMLMARLTTVFPSAKHHRAEKSLIMIASARATFAFLFYPGVYETWSTVMNSKGPEVSLTRTNPIFISQYLSHPSTFLTTLNISHTI